MKKLLIALALGIVLVLALATVASADNGPHGSFTATTDACASCHRVHSAQYGSNALLIMDPEALCLSCHDGLGAGTNVEDGVYMQSGSDAHTGLPGSVVEGTDGASLFGGGFVNALMATEWSGAVTANALFNAASAPTTSMHDIGTSGTVWGSGAVNTSFGSLVLECTNCHDPHGTAGWVTDGNTANNTDTRVATYRLLRWQPQGSNGFAAPATSVNWSGGVFPTSDMGSATGTDTTGWRVPDNFAANGTEWYTIGTRANLSTCGQSGTAACGQPFAVGDYNAGNVEIVYQPLDAAAAPKDYRPAAINTAMFCAQCHDRYFNNSALRNATDLSAYCGKPTVSTSTLVIPIVDDADLGAPWIHPVDPVRCEPIVSATNVLQNWGDNGDSGDSTFTYRHSSGDVRASMDGTVTASTSARVSRSCVACHVSHGTSAAMTSLASDATLAAIAGNDVDNSTLLRMDNRSLCLRCHATTVNFTVAP